MTALRALLVVGATVALWPATAAAYVQTMTCLPSGIYACRPGEVPKPVRWPDRCVSYYINEDGTADIADNARTYAAIQRSFTTWSEVSGAEFAMEYAGLTNEDRAEHVDARGEAGNANVVIWRDDDWPYSSRTAFAITSVTFDPVTGLIADADIELNSEFHRFTTEDGDVVVDVANTLTHEVGHFLGLDHTSINEATMYGAAPVGEVDKRTLHGDDIEGFFATYPQVGITPRCAELPDYFEKPLDDGTKKGCCATTSTTPTPGALLLAVLLGLVWRHRRREAEELVEP